MNKRIFRIGEPMGKDEKGNASTEADLTVKDITPMGGFRRYGIVKED